MNLAERDELLIRLDERSASMNEDLKELKKDVKDANGRQQKTSKKVNILIAFLAGTGILTAGGIGISQLF